MKVCDRCKKPLNTNKETYLCGEHFELCQECAQHIKEHIKNYNPKKKNLLSGFLGQK